MASTGTSNGQPEFKKLLNFRDVGESTRSPATREDPLKPGLLYRSARPDEATPSDRALLKSHYAIKTIIDLRTASEHIAQTQKLAAAIPSAPAMTPPDPAEPLKIPGIEYAEIDFSGPGQSRYLISQLTWAQTLRLAALYAFGYRKEAISVIGVNVMAPKGLTRLMTDSLAYCKPGVKAVFDVLSREEAYPVLMHCTQGKDRTGIVVLLVLLLLRVEREAIERDYRITETAMLPQRAEKVAENAEYGLPEEFADCPSGWVEDICQCVDEVHGGVETYLESCGIPKEQRQRIVKVFRS